MQVGVVEIEVGLGGGVLLMGLGVAVVVVLVGIAPVGLLIGVWVGVTLAGVLIGVGVVAGEWDWARAWCRVGGCGPRGDLP